METIRAITVSDLLRMCREEEQEGNGDKEIYVAVDDEGNGFRPMFYGLTTSQEDIDALVSQGLFMGDPKDTHNIVILG